MLLLTQGLCPCCSLQLGLSPSSWGACHLPPLTSGINLCGLDTRQAWGHLNLTRGWWVLITGRRQLRSSAPPTPSGFPHPAGDRTEQQVRRLSLGSGTAGNHEKDHPGLPFMGEETKAPTIHLSLLPSCLMGLAVGSKN